MQRLDKCLSEAGVASRKELRAMIRAGRVTVDGAVVRDPELRVPDGGSLAVDGEPVRRGAVVLMLNKPAGYVTSTSDPRDRTVMDLLPDAYRRLGVVPVGRLDKETEGLLLFTNDGALAHRLISPRHAVRKVYEAEHEGEADEADAAAFQSGLTLRDGTICRPAELEPLGPGRSRVTLSEGKYHQVRRMLASQGMPVTALRRVAEGGLALGDLPWGAFGNFSLRKLPRWNLSKIANRRPITGAFFDVIE